VLLNACKPPVTKIEDNLERVDSTLRSVKLSVDSLKLLDVEILAMQQKNPRLALMADSLLLTTNSAIDYIDSLKQMLRTADTAGESTAVAYKIISNNNTGVLLYSYLQQMHSRCIKSLTNQNKATLINNVFEDEMRFSPADVFITKCFSGTPTFAASTILTKFGNDCRKAAIIALADIKESFEQKH